MCIFVIKFQIKIHSNLTEEYRFYCLFISMKLNVRQALTIQSRIIQTLDTVAEKKSSQGSISKIILKIKSHK